MPPEKSAAGPSLVWTAEREDTRGPRTRHRLQSQADYPQSLVHPWVSLKPRIFGQQKGQWPGSATERVADPWRHHSADLACPTVSDLCSSPRARFCHSLLPTRLLGGMFSPQQRKGPLLGARDWASLIVGSRASPESALLMGLPLPLRHSS